MIVNGKRALAHTERVSWVRPIEGADNIELIGVLGWSCIAKIGEFKEGDICVYIEIDSRVPEKEWSEFLRAKHFKVKTMRLGKFGVVSQGLALPLDVFEEDIPNKEGVDVTDLLGITYAIKEDNKRKGKGMDKYAHMAKRHPKVFSNPFVRKIMKHTWGKKIMFVFFGKKKTDESYRFPSHYQFIHKTDEERCLIGNTKITTDHGRFRISDIVNKQMNVKVLSANKDGVLEYKSILSYQKYPLDDLISIEYPYKPGVNGRFNHIICTKDHKIYTQRGYVPASELSINDKLYMVDKCYDCDVLAPIYGMLVGDSHIARDKRCKGRLRIVATQGEKQLDYLKYKQSIFESDGKIVDSGLGSYSTVTNYHYSLNVDSTIHNNVVRDWLVNDEKHITKSVIEKFTEESLAFWYMDDGCLSFNASSSKPFIRLNTHAYPLNEVELLACMLQDKFNIACNTRQEKKNDKIYYLIYLPSESTEQFLELVTPYMCQSMSYKTLDNLTYLIGTKVPHYQKSTKLVEIPILDIKNVDNNSAAAKDKYVYDLEIEDNHNFIADNILTHNCESIPWILENKGPWVRTTKIDGTSATYILDRKKKHKYDFYVYSRNIRQFDIDQQTYHDTNVYWEAENKYNIKEKLSGFMDANPDLDYVCLQGEIAGPNIQANPHKFKELRFFGFNFITSDVGRWNTEAAADMCVNKLDIPWVPIVDTKYYLPDTMEELKESADGPCEAPGASGNREGYVYRSKDGQQSFKNVSVKYLLKHNG